MARRLEEIGKLYNLKLLQRLILECYETAAGAVTLYNEAVRSARDPERRLNWQHCLDRARNARIALSDAAGHLDLDLRESTVERRARKLQARTLAQAIRSVARNAYPCGNSNDHSNGNPGDHVSVVDRAIAEIVFAWEMQLAELLKVVAVFLKQCRDPIACRLRIEVADMLDDVDRNVRDASACCRGLWRTALAPESPVSRRRTHPARLPVAGKCAAAGASGPGHVVQPALNRRLPVPLRPGAAPRPL